MVGGGTGGHITPLLAVASELKVERPGLKTIYVGERGGAFLSIAQNSSVFDEIHTISAGKLRRYHNASWLTRIFDIPTNLLNTIDLIKVLSGYIQAKHLLKTIKPNVVFIKGGFVGVPIGWACGKLRIPYITHDSDTLPGLANRMIAKKAFLHTVGMPKEFYSYPADKTEVVGIPLNKDYQEVTPQLQLAYRNQLGLPPKAPIIFITGGSLGSQRLNAYMASIAEELLSTNPALRIIHQVGQGNLGVYANLPGELQSRITVQEFLQDIVFYSGAADIVISRAGATAIAELAEQGKACILVPNPQLTGGHQLSNAAHLAQGNAVKVVHEQTLAKDPEALLISIRALLADNNERTELGRNLHKLSQPHAAQKLATVILESVDYVQSQQNR